MLSGNLQCPKALLQYCGNRSLPQYCGNALRHCGLLQCAQRIAAMAPLRQYCGNKVLQQYCGNAAAIAVLQQHCGNAHCKVLLQYCGNRGHCGNALWHCRNTPIFSRWTCETYRLDRLCGVLPRPSSIEIATLSYTNVVAESDSIVFGGISFPQPSSLSLYVLDIFSKNWWRPKLGNMEGIKNRRERAIPTTGGKCIRYISLWKDENTGNGRTQRGKEQIGTKRQHEDNTNRLTIINCQPCQKHKLSLLFNPKKAVKNGEKGPLQGTYLVQIVSCLLEPLTQPPPPPPPLKKPYMVASESPSHESLGPLSATKAEESVLESCLHFAL